MKPLHGAEPGLYENSRSFLEQDYPGVQLVLGVNHPPRRGRSSAANELNLASPRDDIVLVVDGRIRGSNHKVSNLENMLRSARHNILVLADSDMRVDRRYLAAVTAPLGDAGTGAVTCLYKGTSSGGLWSESQAPCRSISGFSRTRCSPMRWASGAAALAPRSRSAVDPPPHRRFCAAA